MQKVQDQAFSLNRGAGGKASRLNRHRDLLHFMGRFDQKGSHVFPGMQQVCIHPERNLKMGALKVLLFKGVLFQKQEIPLCFQIQTGVAPAVSVDAENAVHRLSGLCHLKHEFPVFQHIFHAVLFSQGNQKFIQICGGIFFYVEAAIENPAFHIRQDRLKRIGIE